MNPNLNKPSLEQLARPAGVAQIKNKEASNQTLHLGDRMVVEIRATPRDSYTEFFVTGTILKPLDVDAAADELFAHLADAMAQHSVSPIQEKIFGKTTVREQVLRKREHHYRMNELEVTSPVTWIMGTPLLGCDFLGVQVWGIRSHGSDVSIRTIETSQAGRGREVLGPGFRMVYLPMVRGTTQNGALAATVPDQTDLMFTNAEQALASLKLSYDHVVRTWIYYAHLLDWYNDLNRIRTRHYHAIGFGKPGRPAYPASTGIQGQCDQEECMMDVLALEQSAAIAPIAIPVIHSPRQEQSFNYGSAFSRGMVFAIDGRRTISISGTASINSAGATIHVGDAELQCFETLMCISAILEQQGGSLENITAATLYCKTPDVWKAWNRVCRLMGVPEFPKVSMVADVCRDDLLVEMEAFAVV